MSSILRYILKRQATNSRFISWILFALTVAYEHHTLTSCSFSFPRKCHLLLQSRPTSGCRLTLVYQYF